MVELSDLLSVKGAAVLVGLLAATYLLWNKVAPVLPLSAIGRRFKPVHTRPGPKDMAEHFVVLREHFASTGQTNRVSTMDHLLAPGVFGTPNWPAEHLKLVAAVVVEGSDEQDDPE